MENPDRAQVLAEVSLLLQLVDLAVLQRLQNLLHVGDAGRLGELRLQRVDLCGPLRNGCIQRLLVIAQVLRDLLQRSMVRAQLLRSPNQRGVQFRLQRCRREAENLDCPAFVTNTSGDKRRAKQAKDEHANKRKLGFSQEAKQCNKMQLSNAAKRNK